MKLGVETFGAGLETFGVCVAIVHLGAVAVIRTGLNAFLSMEMKGVTLNEKEKENEEVKALPQIGEGNL